MLKISSMTFNERRLSPWVSMKRNFPLKLRPTWSFCSVNDFFRHRRVTTTVSLGVLFALFGMVASVYASPFEIYGAGARGSALGNVGSTVSSDYHAVYYNPAALINGQSSLGASLSYSAKMLDVSLSPRPSGYDIPNLGTASPAVPTEYRVNPRSGRSATDHSFTLTTGIATDLKTEDLRFGLLLSLPVYHSVDSYSSAFSDEREQHFSNQLSFSLLGGRLEHFEAQVGVAYRLFEWLSLGVGASVRPDANTRNDIYVNDPARQDEVDLNVGLKTQSSWRLQGGLLIMPNPNFRVGVSYRDEQYMRIRGVNEVQVRGLQGGESYPFEQRLYIINDYTPRQFTYGGAWIGDQALFTADLVYTVWSGFLDAHGIKQDFLDTWSPRIGFEYRLANLHTLRVGASWSPSPIPEQTGRSNFVDNDRAQVSIGSEHKIEIAGRELKIAWYTQFHYLVGQRHRKELVGEIEVCRSDSRSICDEVPDDTIDPMTGQPYPEASGLQTGNPGFPGFSSGGMIIQTGLEVKWEF